MSILELAYVSALPFSTSRVSAGVVTTAGVSARREYEHRRETDRRERSRGLRWTIPCVMGGSLLAFVAVRVGAVFLNRWTRSGFGLAPKGLPHHVGAAAVPPNLANVLALVVAVIAGLSLAATFWGPRQATEAWRQGARRG